MMGAPGPAVQLLAPPRGSSMRAISVIEPNPFITPSKPSSESSNDNLEVMAAVSSGRSKHTENTPNIDGVVWADHCADGLGQDQPPSRRKRNGGGYKHSGLTPKAKRQVLNETIPTNSLELCDIPYEMAKEGYRF